MSSGTGLDWILALETQALVSGRALTSAELGLAQDVGVAHPEEVRILSVHEIPLPTHPRLKQLAQQFGLFNAYTRALAVRYGVIVRLDCACNLRLLTHEFVHVAQYERLGLEGFLGEYIHQIAVSGYRYAPLELEAEDKATKAYRDAFN